MVYDSATILRCRPVISKSRFILIQGREKGVNLSYVSFTPLPVLQGIHCQSVLSNCIVPRMTQSLLVMYEGIRYFFVLSHHLIVSLCP